MVNKPLARARKPEWPLQTPDTASKILRDFTELCCYEVTIKECCLYEFIDIQDLKFFVMFWRNTKSPRILCLRSAIHT